MIGEQPTGAIDGVRISAVAHEGLRITVDGKPARLGTEAVEALIRRAKEPTK